MDPKVANVGQSHRLGLAILSFVIRSSLYGQTGPKDARRAR